MIVVEIERPHGNYCAKRNVDTKLVYWEVETSFPQSWSSLPKDLWLLSGFHFNERDNTSISIRIAFNNI